MSADTGPRSRAGAAAISSGWRVRDSVDRTRLVERLHERQIAVSFRGDAVRVAPHLYNDADDTAALLVAIE